MLDKGKGSVFCLKHMPKLNERGVVAQFLVLLILAVGIGVGIYLVQTGNLKLFSKAVNPAIVFKSAAGESLPKNSSGVPITTSPTVKIEFTSTLGQPASSTGGAVRVSAPTPVTTKSFKFAEDPVSLAKASYQPYTKEPMVVDYTFKSSAKGSKSIFVSFLASSGKTEIKIASLELTAVVSDNYHVKPYLVYPSDKPMYPEYEAAVKSYLVELQNWYKAKVGVTFTMDPLKVVRSSYTYNVIRCDPGPFDSTPPSSACLNDPKKLDGNLGMYMNLAIHNGTEKWDQKTATLVFSAGGGGYAGANRDPSNDTGWAIVGDWVLEPISGKANDWGIPCKYSDGWQCSAEVSKGTPAHELGHAFGLPHPDTKLYPGEHLSIMRWQGEYPAVGFLPYEVDFLKKSPFFALTSSPTPTASPSSSPSVNCYDTDGGKNPNVAGTVYFQGKKYGTEFCNFNDPPAIRNKKVLEYWCETPNSKVVQLEWMPCANGCSNGACK